MFLGLPSERAASVRHAAKGLVQVLRDDEAQLHRHLPRRAAGALIPLLERREPEGAAWAAGRLISGTTVSLLERVTAGTLSEPLLLSAEYDSPQHRRRSLRNRGRRETSRSCMSPGASIRGDAFARSRGQPSNRQSADCVRSRRGRP